MKEVKNKFEPNTEDLLVNGVSVIFSSVKLFEKKLDDTTLETVIRKCGLKKIESSDYGYIEKIFTGSESNFALIFDTGKSGDLYTTIKLEDNTSVIPVIRHHVLFFQNNAILVQSIIVIDYRKITHTHCDITDISRPLSVTDLLAIIHDLKRDSSDNGRDLNNSVNKLFSHISEIAGVSYTDYSKSENINKRNSGIRQNVAIQLWDLASLPDNCDRKNITGDYLESRYELDLNALLNLENEHLTQNGLWRNLSSSLNREAVENNIDALKDHRVLTREKICVEISQVDAPSFRTVSEKRLQKYGYDSASAFLWGILSIIEVGVKYCYSELNKLYQCALTDESISVVELSKQKERILLERDNFVNVKILCVEDRHKIFLSNGYEKKGLNDFFEKISDRDKRIQNRISVIISYKTADTSNDIKALLKELENNTNQTANTSNDIKALLKELENYTNQTANTSNDIKALLKELEEYTKEQDRTNDKISLLSFILAITSIFSVADYFEGVFDTKSTKIKLILLVIVIFIFIIIALPIIFKDFIIKKIKK